MSAQSDAPLKVGGVKIPNFDPREVPVVGSDTHLPAVPAVQQSARALRARFMDPPRWNPEVRQEDVLPHKVITPAAVLVPLVQRKELTVLLTQRTQHLSTHAGQVAFPGGKQDAHDSDAQATALREAQEEIGLDAAQVEVLGCLPQYQTGSAYMVTPVVALVPPHVRLQLNRDEVESAFEVPLHFLLNPANHLRQRFQWRGQSREWFAMPYNDGHQERFIWGATAGMLRNLYRFMSA